jgi:hypothetical protein
MNVNLPGYLDRPPNFSRRGLEREDRTQPKSQVLLLGLAHCNIEVYRPTAAPLCTSHHINNQPYTLSVLLIFQIWRHHVG